VWAAKQERVRSNAARSKTNSRVSADDKHELPVDPSTAATSSLLFVGPRTKVRFCYNSYRIVFTLDLTCSVAVPDPVSGDVLYDVALTSLVTTILSLLDTKGAQGAANGLTPPSASALNTFEVSVMLFATRCCGMLCDRTPVSITFMFCVACSLCCIQPLLFISIVVQTGSATLSRVTLSKDAVVDLNMHSHSSASSSGGSDALSGFSSTVSMSSSTNASSNYGMVSGSAAAGTHAFAHVTTLVHGFLVTRRNVTELASWLKRRFRTLEHEIRDAYQSVRPENSTGGPRDRDQNRDLARLSTASQSPLAAFVQNSLFVLDRLPASACPLLVLLTDGVVVSPDPSSTPDVDGPLTQCISRDIPCHCVQISTSSFHPHRAFGYIPEPGTYATSCSALVQLHDSVCGPCLTRLALPYVLYCQMLCRVCSMLLLVIHHARYPGVHRQSYRWRVLRL